MAQNEESNANTTQSDGFNVNHVMHGFGGNAWWNGKRIATLLSVEAKVTAELEDLKVCGSTTTYQLYNGYSGEGTLTFAKIDSQIIKDLANAYQSGVMPEITIITSQKQGGTNAVERVSYTGVTVSEFNLAKFEAGARTDVEIPFKFSGFEVLETI